MSGFSAPLKQFKKTLVASPGTNVPNLSDLNMRPGYHYLVTFDANSTSGLTTPVKGCFLYTGEDMDQPMALFKTGSNVNTAYAAEVRTGTNDFVARRYVDGNTIQAAVYISEVHELQGVQ